MMPSMVYAEKWQKALDEFLSGRVRSTWVQEGYASVYLRKSQRYVEGRVVTALDIANIVVDPICWRMGVCTETFRVLHSNNPYQITYVENVLNNYLFDHLKKAGYILLPHKYDRCFYKRTYSG